jgi:cytochrome b561
MIKRIRLDRKTVFVSDSQTHWQLVLILLAVVLMGWLILSQQKRLNLYDRWYMCMYQDWNYERCNQQVYGD